MTPLYIKLGDGRHCVAQSTRDDGTPALTIRALPEPREPGELLEQAKRPASDYALIVEVSTPQAAGALLSVAQAIAFAHGIKP